MPTSFDVLTPTSGEPDVLVQVISSDPADDPSLTQPLMYKVIDSKRSARKLYTEALIGRGDI